MVTTWPQAAHYDPLGADTLARWARFLRADRVFFPTYVGLQLEEVRRGYARLRLPVRAEVQQAAGVLHGGALATLVDTACIPAIGTFYNKQPEMLTVSMTINYVGVVAGEDAYAEAWVEQGGRSVAFVRAEVRSASGSLAATASIVFKLTQAS